MMEWHRLVIKDAYFIAEDVSHARAASVAHSVEQPSQRLDRRQSLPSSSRYGDRPAANHRFADPDIVCHIFDGHHLPQIDHQLRQTLRVVAMGFDLREDRVQNLLAATTFQARCPDEQHDPVQADPWCMNNSIKCSSMNHIPVAAFRTLVTRLRCLHPNMKYPAFSPTVLMFVA